MTLPKVTESLHPGDLEDPKKGFENYKNEFETWLKKDYAKELETWIKNVIAELHPQETEEIKKELSDLTSAIKQLTERIDNLERKL
ncbi:MAG: hypothetical protein FWF19_04885 [Euryarchaeota archaeon]|nr:hypothetical protein [Euryarchaeota archaeon]